MSGATPIVQIPAITGVRGLAALWVVAYHFRECLFGHGLDVVQSVIGNGYLAVDLFFILSGFVITLNYRWLSDAFSVRSATAFIIARFARIYPVHLFMTAVFLINPAMILLFSTAKTLGDRYDSSYFLLSLLLMQNWGLTGSVAWNIPSWSISTEWFAYLIFPVFLWGVSRSRETGRTIVAKIAAALILLAGFFTLIGASSLGADIAQLGLPRCLFEFLIGTMLCRFYLTVGAPGRPAQALYLLLALCCVIISFVAALPDYALLPTAFAVLIFCLTSNRSAFCRSLACKPLLWLGEISYSLYMVHYFVKDWVKILGGALDLSGLVLFFSYLGLALAAGAIVHAWIEKPGRQYFRTVSLEIGATGQ